MRIPVLLFLPVLLHGCDLFGPRLRFYISNESADQPAVHLLARCGDRIIFDDTIRHTPGRPDLLHIRDQRLRKGAYELFVVVAGSGTTATRRVPVDGEKYISIAYEYTAPADSNQLEALRRGYPSDSSRIAFRRAGVPPGLRITVSDATSAPD